MLIFIDETGDLGFDFSKPGTSSHFVITALVLAQDKLRKALEGAVARTIKNKMNVGKRGKKKPTAELKGRATVLPITRTAVHRPHVIGGEQRNSGGRHVLLGYLSPPFSWRHGVV
jgi:hypothetical protein